MNHDCKTNEGRNFQFTKFSFIDFVLNDRRSLSGKRPKSSSDKSSSCRFSFSAERNANTKATEDVTSSFLLVYWFSYPCRKVWTSLSVSNTYFFSVLDAIIWESSDKQLLLRIVRALPFIHQPDRVAPKASDVSAADLLYQYTWKNTRKYSLKWKKNRLSGLTTKYRSVTESKRQYENIRRQKKTHIDDGYQGGGCSSLQKGTENNSLKPTYDPVLHVVTQTTKKCSIWMYLWLEFWPFSG